MGEKELLEKAAKKYTKEELAKLEKALDFAKDRLRNVIATVGGTAIDHNMTFASVVIDLGLGVDATIVALFHNFPRVENGVVGVDAEFGADIKKAIEKFEEVDGALEKNPEFGKKLFLSMSKDIQLTLLLSTHALVNMQRLERFPLELRGIKSSLVGELYIPITAKLGVFYLKSQLEDLLFKVAEPEKYEELAAAIKKEEEPWLNKIDKIIDKVQDCLAEKGIDAKIQWRVKRVFSTYEKMKRKDIGLNQMYDLCGFRIIVSTVKDCYETLGIIHSMFRPISEEFDDYIAKPKPNLYQSIHTAVLGFDSGPLEFQIRTNEMHINAEFGLAAHWKYKGHKSTARYDRSLVWLKQLFEWQKQYKKRIDSRHAKFFKNKIFVITPKGDIIELPESATALDFAYAIHGDVGHKCSKIKVNGKMVGFDYALQNGDNTEVITSKKLNVKRHWLNIVKTERAKQSIMKKLEIKFTDRPASRPFPEIKNILKVKAADHRLRFAKCCSPVSGDDIVGYITTKRKISVHRRDCLEGKKLKKPIGVEIEDWAVDKGKPFSTKITVLAKDRSTVLTDLLNKIGETGANLLSTNAQAAPSNMVKCDFEVINSSRNAFLELIELLEAVDGVQKVEKI